MKMPRLHCGAAVDIPETTKLPPIPEDVWQQPQETHLIDIHKNSTTNIQRKIHVESQTSPIKETSPQVSGSDPESFLENQTRSTPLQCLNDSKKQQPEIQQNETDMTTYDSGDDNISAPKTTTSHIEERLMRDDFTNELYMPLSSTFFIKRKKEMLFVPLNFENDLTVDALVDSGAYVSAIAQKEWGIIKEQAPSNILKIDDIPNFQIQVASGQLEKPIATATLKFDTGDHIFAEHFVVMKNLPDSIIGLHFMRHNRVVIDTTHGPIHFPHFTMQVKSALSQTSAKPQAVFIHASKTIPQMTRKNNHSICWSFIGMEYNRNRNSSGKFTETASLIISHSILSVIDRKVAVRVTNTTESPYTITKTTQMADFSVVIPEQCKFIKPVDTAILDLIPEGDSDLTTYFTELLRMKKSDQQNNIFWFRHPKTLAI